MSTSKRKKGAGGASETDDSGNETQSQPVPKKVYRPITISQLEQAYPPSGSRPSVSSRSQSRPPVNPLFSTPTVRPPSKINPKTSIPPTPRDTPLFGEGSSRYAVGKATTDYSDDDTSGRPDSPIVSMPQKAGNHSVLSSDNESPLPAATVTSRQRVRMERDIDTVRSGLEIFETRVDQRMDKLEERQTDSERKQDLIIGKLDDLVALFKGSQVSAPATPVSLAPQDEKLKTPVNPPPDPNHQTIADSIQSRRERDKTIEGIPSKYVAQAQKLTRNVTKSLLDEDKLSSGEGECYFKKNGQPDFFPPELTRDGYCRPFPHPGLSFSQNYPWFSTFTNHFRKMMPKDGSDFAKLCETFTDRQLLVLLHDGPFRTMAAAWRKAHPPSDSKSGKDEAEDQAKRRQGLRLEGKAFGREDFRPEIRDMSGPKWDAAWCKHVMSPVVTDDEGGIVVHQPEWRSGWITNLYRRMDSATRALVLAKPGPHSPLPKTTFVKVDGVPPTIYKGKGKDKKIVKIPLTMISKQWLKNPDNAAWVKDSPHLIDSSMTRKPNLSTFFDAHPAPVEPEPEPKPEVTQPEFEVGYEGGEEDEAEEGAFGDEGGLERMAFGRVYDAGGLDAGPGQVDEGNDDLYANDDLSAPAPAPTPAPREHGLGTSSEPEANFVIDPGLIELPGANISACSRPHISNAGSLANTQSCSIAPTAALPLPSQTQGGSLPGPFSPAVSPELAPHVHSMPIPPTLSQQQRDADAKVAAEKAGIPQPTNRKGRGAGGQKVRTHGKQVEPAAPGPSTLAAEVSNTPGEPVKRGRGRPRGSKNKKTLERENLKAEARRE